MSLKWATWRLLGAAGDWWTEPNYRLFVVVQPNTNPPPAVTLAGTDEAKSVQIIQGWLEYAIAQGYDAATKGYGLYYQSFGASPWGDAADAVPGQSSSIFRATGKAAAISSMTSRYTALKTALDSAGLPYPTHLWLDDESPTRMIYNAGGGDGTPGNYDAWLADGRASSEELYDGQTLDDYDASAPAFDAAKTVTHADNAAYLDWITNVVNEVTAQDLYDAHFSTFGAVFGTTPGGSNYSNTRASVAYDFALPSSAESCYPKLDKTAGEAERRTFGPARGRAPRTEPLAHVFQRRLAAQISTFGRSLDATGETGDVWFEAPGYDWSGEESADYIAPTTEALAAPLRIAAANGAIEHVLFWNYEPAFTATTMRQLSHLIRQAE